MTPQLHTDEAVVGGWTSAVPHTVSHGAQRGIAVPTAGFSLSFRSKPQRAALA